MRLPVLVLTALLALLQYPLWLGKGGWFKVWEHEEQLAAVQARNETLRQRNARIQAELRDLKQGTLAVEERARYELGMLREGELFVRYLDKPEESASSRSNSTSSESMAARALTSIAR